MKSLEDRVEILEKADEDGRWWRLWELNLRLKRSFLSGDSDFLDIFEPLIEEEV